MNRYKINRKIIVHTSDLQEVRTSSMENNELNTWKQKNCQDVYRKLINYAGGFNVVRKGKRAEAKQIAINYCLKNKQIDYEEFKLGVEKANLVNSERKARQATINKKVIDFNKEIGFIKEQEKIDKIMNEIYAEFGVEVPLLSKPIFIEDAEKLYNDVKNNNKLRDVKLFI